MSAHRDRERGRGSARSRGRDESGNILILFAILLPLFLFTGMIVIDVGYWWANGRKAQIAADACALAAASELPQSWDPPLTACYFDGEDYVLTNLPDQSAGPDAEPLHVSTEVLSPYDGNPTQVEATVEMKVQTFFGRFVGLGGVSLTRRAVAEQATGQGNYAIYSHSDDCPTSGGGHSLVFDGKHHSINGRVHSNGEYDVGNDADPPDYEYFWAKEGTSVQCFHASPPGTAHFGGANYLDPTGTQAPTTVPPQTWPAWWTPAELGWDGTLDVTDTGCDVKGRSIEIKEFGGGTLIQIDSPIGLPPLLFFPGNKITIPYVYCAWEKFTINRQNLEATMTVLSPEIIVNENNQKLTAYKGTASGKVLFFAVPNVGTQQDGSMPLGNPDCIPDPAKEMKLNGNQHEWSGVIFNPCGEVVVNVGGATAGTSNITGTILGLRVKVNGEDFVMKGESAFGGTVILALDQ